MIENTNNNNNCNTSSNNIKAKNDGLKLFSIRRKHKNKKARTNIENVSNDWIKKKSSVLYLRHSNHRLYYETENLLLKSLNAARNEREALKILNIMWKNAKFCDLIFNLNGQEFLAHKVLLAFYSDKLRLV
jgi:hypothetical protein